MSTLDSGVAGRPDATVSADDRVQRAEGSANVEPHDPGSGLGESDRLGALRRTALGISADDALDRFASMVRRVLDVPLALVCLVDDRRQFFPGQSGLPEAYAAERQTPLSHSFCQHVVLRREPLVVEDARTDPRGRLPLDHRPGRDRVRRDAPHRCQRTRARLALRDQPRAAALDR